MQILAEKNYLWLPVDMAAEEIIVNIFSEGRQIQEISIRLGSDRCDFYGVWKMEPYRGKMLEIVPENRSEDAEKEREMFRLIRQENSRPENSYPYRPRLHYTPAYGWVNDPNGLVYYKGKYHLYHQYNPFSTEWENMSWGHAVSTNLFDWEELDTALTPDEYGVAYSGCAFVDKYNAAGHGEDALLFYYTAAGGRNHWSVREGNKFTQRLLFSGDEGMTMHPDPDGILPWMAEENRDPKIFYHKDTDAYVMILYLDENDFAIFRSKDLKHWEESQRLTVPGMWECPAFEELTVEGTGEKKWMFWSADGYYQIGSFDGYRFTAETERLTAYCSRRAYAAQTYDNTAGRVLMLPWIRLDNARGYYHGAMGIPMELTLRETGEGLRLAFGTPGELEALRSSWTELKPEQSVQIGEECRELCLEFGPDCSGTAELSVGETVIHADLQQGRLKIDTPYPHSQDEETAASFDPSAGLKLRILIDQEMLEVIGMDGLIYGTFETEENVLGKEIKLRTDETPECFRWCSLRGRS